MESYVNIIIPDISISYPIFYYSKCDIDNEVSNILDIEVDSFKEIRKILQELCFKLPKNGYGLVLYYYDFSYESKINYYQVRHMKIKFHYMRDYRNLVIYHLGITYTIHILSDDYYLLTKYNIGDFIHYKCDGIDGVQQYLEDNIFNYELFK